ncbi:DHA2 family efflux MFS transporter permease subunit [Cryobacterium sp. MDB1-18-2]|uniref:DHA2 family efflux MFS transporter permease subunit n=2 Tax=Microbacteriaceae TaxID=85023 RepID=A0ABY2IL94_9MICO|nr:DHA2 family efflux MFS transporter permease subunit [Cryobacterium sp. MDB2-A-1]TFC06707.1 DHA2 family efflux MFS transporter permease subunit [Cryobacterium sp. MDB2-33-2]TFC15903.1 DHA2 family efflux MFS transporter permease subunit [Cryobacterium sp. MDB2-A-2]TFC17153.1 DHA2 family efflux MFS transporter permease subunit [Cryobacterium sp. MDB2-10]TFC19710.1 DHA2 family efflux MFS transporter permease subunit [Cryobacterium glucosi]TFC28090.1 DHA2 family efflux MFS transporter permease s
MFMATLDNLVVTGALPVINRDLGASIEELQWVINAYSLSFATFMLMAVAIGDRFGRRTVFLAGIAIFTVASALAGLSTEPWQLITARAIQGVGAAALMPLSLTLLVGSVSEKRRPAAIGIWGGISGLGVALGPLIGGAVVEGWNWQAIFWLNVPLGVISIPLALVALPNSFGARVRADVVGLVLAGVGVFGLVYGIVRGNDAGWTSLEVLGALAGGAVLLAAFIAWEARTPDPLLPLRLFRDRSFTVANLVGLTFSFGIFGSIFILIQFLQIVQGHTPLEAGLMTMPWTLAPMVIAPLTGLLSPRTGTRLPIVLGLSFLAIAMGWLAVEMSATVAYIDLVPAFLLAGVGMGLVFAPSSTAVLANMVPNDHAKATGTNSTLREIGVALGVAVLTAVFTGAGGELTPTGYVDAAVPAIVVGASVLGLAALIGLALPHGRRAPAATPVPEPATLSA